MSWHENDDIVFLILFDYEGHFDNSTHSSSTPVIICIPNIDKKDKFAIPVANDVTIDIVCMPMQLSTNSMVMYRYVMMPIDLLRQRQQQQQRPRQQPTMMMIDEYLIRVIYSRIMLVVVVFFCILTKKKIKENRNTK